MLIVTKIQLFNLGRNAHGFAATQIRTYRCMAPVCRQYKPGEPHPTNALVAILKQSRKTWTASWNCSYDAKQSTETTQSLNRKSALYYFFSATGLGAATASAVGVTARGAPGAPDANADSPPLKRTARPAGSTRRAVTKINRFRLLDCSE